MFSNIFNRARVKVVPNLYHTHAGDVFLPGAGNAVFEPAFALPLITANGRATFSGPPPRPLSGPQIRVNQTTRVAGLGGIISGQLITQPLNVPDTTNGSQ